jgi:hypothetical protein
MGTPPVFSDVALFDFPSFDRLPKTRRRDSHAQGRKACRIVRNGVKMNYETLQFRLCLDPPPSSSDCASAASSDAARIRDFVGQSRAD